jgi:hypothetical protein
MVDWEVTATTIYCDAVDDEVTLIVQRDFSVKCTGYNRYSKTDMETLGLLRRKSKQAGRQLGCVGLECPLVIKYRDKLIAEESKSGE